MANKAPFFVSGAACKIRVNGVTMAFATDFQCSVRINHVGVKVLGVYERDTSEPMSYDVEGSFTLLRYVDGAASRAQRYRYKVPNGVSDLGNGVGSWSVNAASPAKAIQRSGNFTNDGRANEALDPSKLHTATWFDIEIFQKVNDGQLGIMKINNCRITGADTSISKRGLMTQTFTFTANTVDEDSFLANASGVGQTTA